MNVPTMTPNFDSITVDAAKTWCSTYTDKNPFVLDIKSKLAKGLSLSVKQEQALASHYSRHRNHPNSHVRLLEPNTSDPNKAQILDFVKNYYLKGSFPFMLSMQKEFALGKGLTTSQWEAVIKCFQKERGSLVPVAHAATAQPIIMTRLANPVPIVVNRWTAMHIKKTKKLSYGPFTLEVVAVNPKNRFMYTVRINASGSVNVCRICGKSLTDHNSKVSGIGPVCAKNIGMYNTYKTSIQQFMASWQTMVNAVGEFDIMIKSRAIKEGYGALMSEVRDACIQQTGTVIPPTPTPIAVTPVAPPKPTYTVPVIKYNPASGLIITKTIGGNPEMFIKDADFRKLMGQSKVDILTKYFILVNVDTSAQVQFERMPLLPNSFSGDLNGKKILFFIQD